MAKCSIILFVASAFLVISGIFAEPEVCEFSLKQISRLREVAAQWKNVINFEKRPCDDTYDFVCRGKTRPKSGVDAKIKFVGREPTQIARARAFARACDDFKSEKIDNFIKSFKLSNSIGNWPALDEEWDDRKFNLPLAIAEMNSYNVPVIFNVYFNNDYYETFLEINKEELVNIEENKDLFISKFQNIGVKNPEDVLDDAALFENTFKEAAESTKSATDIKVTSSELEDHLSGIDWDKEIEILYGEKLPKDYPVMLKSHEELKNIYKAVSKLNPKVIANYFFCSYVYNAYTYNMDFIKVSKLFLQILRRTIIQQSGGKLKDIYKEMCITIMETLEEVYPKLNSEKISEQIINFVNKNIFRYWHEEILAMEYNIILQKNQYECAKTLHEFQQLYKKRQAKLFLNNRNAVVYKIKTNLIENLNNMLKMIYDPSPFIFQTIIRSILPSIIDYNKNTTGFTNAEIECFSKQFTDEVTENGMKTMLAAQLVLKTFVAWMERNPNVVEQENKILKEYGLSVEELFIFSFGLYGCEQEVPYKIMVTAAGNSMDFPKLYDCPIGTKLNVEEKCNLL